MKAQLLYAAALMGMGTMNPAGLEEIDVRTELTTFKHYGKKKASVKKVKDACKVGARGNIRKIIH